MKKQSIFMLKMISLVIIIFLTKQFLNQVKKKQILVIKNIYHKYVDDKTKKEVVKTCVLAIEQIYTELHGREKLDKCLEYASEILNEKGVFITDIELRLLIESAVKEFNYRFNSDNDNIDEEAGE